MFVNLYALPAFRNKKRFISQAISWYLILIQSRLFFLSLNPIFHKHWKIIVMKNKKKKKPGKCIASCQSKMILHWYARLVSTKTDSQIHSWLIFCFYYFSWWWNALFKLIISHVSVSLFLRLCTPVTCFGHVKNHVRCTCCDTWSVQHFV